ncbi:hypothetical protein TESG_08344 [Trichophyton tonsurans CBS 112818]|uniref:Uncharacterized protein n=1 Tax=Trichophyton tonsurans (strain CBS 112818) TaxID=647933 RepID=F2RTT0_TRIT1|nr:hypothetical protein TESG_08344 [Trichophyton tonsurans CBS 112818]
MYRLEKDRSKNNYSEPTEGKEVESRRVEHECKRPPAWAESGRGSRDAESQELLMQEEKKQKEQQKDMKKEIFDWESRKMPPIL